MVMAMLLQLKNIKTKINIDQSWYFFVWLLYK